MLLADALIEERLHLAIAFGVLGHLRPLHRAVLPLAAPYERDGVGPAIHVALLTRQRVDHAIQHLHTFLVPLLLGVLLHEPEFP